MPTFAARLLPAAFGLAFLAVAPVASGQTTVTRDDILAQLTTPGTAADFDLASAGDLPGFQALADRSAGGQTWDLTPFTWQAGSVVAFAPASGPVLF